MMTLLHMHEDGRILGWLHATDVDDLQAKCHAAWIEGEGVMGDIATWCYRQPFSSVPPGRHEVAPGYVILAS